MRAIFILALLVSPAAADVAVVKQLIAVMREPVRPVLEQIRADCNFRHRGSAGVAEACFSKEHGQFIALRDVYAQNHKARGVIVYCMDENRTPNGFDWTRTSWCYERLIVTR